MFSKENRAWLYDDEPKAVPIQSAEPPFALPVAETKRRIGIVSFGVILVAIVGGIAIVGVTMDRPRTLPESHVVAKAETSAAVPTKTEQPAKQIQEPQKKAEEKIEPLAKQELPKAEPKESPKPTPIVKASKPHPDAGNPQDELIEAKTPVYVSLEKAKADANGKPILLWLGGILRNKAARSALDEIGDAAIHVQLDDEGNEYDKIGPRVSLLGTWYVPEAKLEDRIDVIKARLTKPVAQPKASKPPKAGIQEDSDRDIVDDGTVDPDEAKSVPFYRGPIKYGLLLREVKNMPDDLDREIKSYCADKGRICYVESRRMRAFIDDGEKVFVLLPGSCCTFQEYYRSQSDN